MASYHCTAKIGAKGKAGPHAAYIAREGKYERSTKNEDLEFTASGNMPAWAEHQPAEFWKAADEFERANGSAYREIEVALPRELNPEQRRELVEDFIAQEIGDGHAYQYAIHIPKAALEKGDQPHAHIMYSERMRDGIERDPEQYFKRYNAKAPERGGCRKFSGGKGPTEIKAELLATRERWANVQNVHLERHGHAARVDHRSLKEQGIDRQPEKHLGPVLVKRLPDFDVSALLARRAAEGELARAQREVSSIDLSGDLKAAIADRDRRAVAPVFTKPLMSAKEMWAAHPDNPDNIAKREAAPAKPETKTTQERFQQRQAEQRATIMKAARQVAEREIERKPAPPKVSQQEADALELQAAIGKKTQWEALLKTERTAYLKELTAQAHAKAVAGVAEHQAHVDAKPLMLGRQKWAEQRERFEHRDAANRLEWQNLKDGRYPFLTNDQEAVHKAVERRVSDKKPELALSMPGVYAALQAGRERAAVVEAQARAEKAKYREVDAALAAFEVHARKREMKTASYGDYRDTGGRWNAISPGMREAIDGYNSVPKEARPIVLEGMRKNMVRAPQDVEKFAQQLGQAKEQSRDQGMRR